MFEPILDKTDLRQARLGFVVGPNLQFIEPVAARRQFATGAAPRFSAATPSAA